MPGRPAIGSLSVSGEVLPSTKNNLAALLASYSPRKGKQHLQLKSVPFGLTFTFVNIGPSAVRITDLFTESFQFAALNLNATPIGIRERIMLSDASSGSTPMVHLRPQEQVPFPISGEASIVERELVMRVGDDVISMREVPASLQVRIKVEVSLNSRREARRVPVILTCTVRLSAE